ncbi:MAG: hypothetical protein H8E12_16865 [Rhodobacteraceae bacterium]|nr:hypothetical protein [Paracoccaceae bacterium]
MLANMFSRRFANLVSEMHSDSLDLEALKGTGVESKILAKQNEIEQDVRALLDEESRIHKERE